MERTLGECLTVTVHSKSVDLSLSLLATLQLLRRFCFGLRASSSNVHQPASLRIHRQGRNTGYLTKDTHMHTRCKTQPKSQRWCSATQTARWYIIISFQTNANLITLHWRYLIYDHSTSPRRNPSSLVNVLDPPRAAALVPADGTLVPQLPPYQPVFATNPVQLQRLPQSRPISSEEHEGGDLVAITRVWWFSTCQRPMTVLILLDQIALVTSPRVGGVGPFPV